MRRPHANRASLGAALVAAAAALAMLVLPGLAASHKGHHHPDHADAGTIRAFDRETGMLAISLTEGGTISGLVVRRTKIRCGEDRGDHHGRRGLPRLKRDREAGSPSRDGSREDAAGTGSEDGAGRGRGDDPPGDDGTAPGRSEDPGQGADRCGVDDLVPGATVKLAELVLTNGNAFFRLVGLAGQAPAAAPQPGAGEEAPAAG